MKAALSEAAPGGWGPSSDPGVGASSPGSEDGPQPPGRPRRGAVVSSHPYEPQRLRTPEERTNPMSAIDVRPRTLGLLGVIALAAAPARGEDPPARPTFDAEQVFNQADADSDGKMSKKEFQFVT